LTATSGFDFVPSMSIARIPSADDALMVSIGRRIGEFVVMCLKGTYMSPRPSQLAPAITPMFDPPVPPAFPAGMPSSRT
jgi:hypothetical protein